MRSTDVLIAGGGPAGLLLATKLAPHVRVCLVDKGTLGETSKFWLSTRARLQLHQLEHCSHFSSNKVTLDTFLGSRAEAIGDFAVVAEEEFLQCLLGRCRDAGVDLEERNPILGVSWCNRKLIASTKSGQIATDILVDATGGMSGIASTFRLHRIDGFFSVFGCHLRDVELFSEEIVGASVRLLGYPAPIFELIPTGPTSALAVVFVISQKAQDPYSLQESFSSYLSSGHFFAPLTAPTAKPPKLGVIPIGRARRRAVERVVPFGEAAMIQAPLLGTAFNDTLEQCDRFAAKVLASLGGLGAHSRWKRLPSTLEKRFNDAVQLVMVRRLTSGGVDAIDWLVRVLRGLGPSGAYRLCSGRLRAAEALRCIALAGIRAGR